MTAQSESPKPRCAVAVSRASRVNSASDGFAGPLGGRRAPLGDVPDEVFEVDRGHVIMLSP